jgi:hypothetical protein
MKANEQSTKQIDFYKFISKFQFNNETLLISYLTEIWFDLRLRSDELELGINKSTFLQVII